MRIRVDAAEHALDVQVTQTRSNWLRMTTVAHRAFTPARLLGSGFVAGLLVGFTAPLSKLGGSSRLIQFATQLAGLATAIQAQVAAQQATEAADEVTEAADTAAVAADTATDAVAEAEPALARMPRDAA